MERRDWLTIGLDEDTMVEGERSTDLSDGVLRHLWIRRGGEVLGDEGRTGLNRRRKG